MFNKRLLSDALIVALAPVYGYCLLHIYYAAMERSYGMPNTLSGPEFYVAIWLGAAIGAAMFVSYCVADWIAALIPAQNPWFIRARRIVQTILFICFGLYFSIIPSLSGNAWFMVVIALLILVSPVILLLLAREYFLPIFLLRKKYKKKTERLSRYKDGGFYATSLAYHKDLLRGTRIGLLAIPLLVIAINADSMGAAAGNVSKARNYIIIDSSPKQIVLIDYGSQWLAAKYDDSYPGMPAYRKEYSIIKADDRSKYTFTIKHIDQLYVYND